MTDRDTLTAMLDRAKIKWESGPTTGVPEAMREGASTVLIHTDGQEIRYGYFGFFSEFVFDKDGALILYGAWE